MKKLNIAMSISFIAALVLVTIAFALIGNGNFETGDFTGWTKSSFINNGFNAAHGGGGSDLSAIVGGAAVVPLSLSDPHTGGVIKYPAYGHYSARVNSDLSYLGGGFPQNANVITQNITAVLNPVDNLAHVRFTYAAVMVNPVDHIAEEKPYFRVRAINTSKGNDVLYDFSSYVDEPGKNWQNGPVFLGADTWKYIDWNYVDLTSSAAHPVTAGDIIILEITAAGCSPGGHPGYVYVDEITDGNIAGPSINATGPATGIAGSTITYTYTYKNGSASAATLNVAINPPVNVTFTGDSDVNCNGTAPVACTFSNVESGASGSFTVTGTIAGAAAGTTIAHSDYNISATGFPTLSGQTVLTVVSAGVVVTGPSINATGPATAIAGSTITYTYNYKNGSAPAAALNVSITPPINVTFTSASDINCNGTNPVACTFSNVAADASGSFTVTGTVASTAAGTTITHSNYDISAAGFPAVGGPAVLTDVSAPAFSSTNVLLNSVLPTSRSVQVGTPITFWNSILNVGPDIARDVKLVMISPPPGTYNFWHTDCYTNAIIGPVDPVVDIPPAPNNWFCYMTVFTPTAPFASVPVHVQAQSSNILATTLVPGLNTMTLKSTIDKGSDLIALSTTSDLHQVACSGTTPFAVSMSNIGQAASSDVTITANTGSAVLPISVSIQETNPPDGVVIGDNVLQNVIEDDRRAAVIWVTFNGCVPFDPNTNRLFIEFRDASNNLLGSTSTAISTNR